MITHSPVESTNPIFAPPVDWCQATEPVPDPDCVWIEDEPKPKVKNEFQTFEQIVRHPTVDTLKRLLLLGVEATVERPPTNKSGPPWTRVRRIGYVTCTRSCC